MMSERKPCLGNRANQFMGGWQVLVLFLLLFTANGLRVGNVSFDPLNIEVWADSKKLYLKGLDKDQQAFLFDGKESFPLPEESFPYCYIITNSLSELALRSFIGFFKDAPDVHWPDLIDEIPARDANLFLQLPEKFWASLDLPAFARLEEMLSHSPVFDRMISKYGAELVSRSVSSNLLQLMSLPRRNIVNRISNQE